MLFSPALDPNHYYLCGFEVEEDVVKLSLNTQIVDPALFEADITQWCAEISLMMEITFS